ncbi:DUF4241 domain-containing protein [Lentzea sp. NPDC042327]|uniref:DUF4241 domain-containing protein n=1 Tax=Lentzea sp. NPDC042327 TaxID=3154801 RepID=UPI0033D4718B
MTTTLEVVYCEGWDPDRREVSGRLPVAVARERDRAGEQYAFCLVEPETGRVTVVAEIAWGVHFARWWFLDPRGRRRRMHEYRVLDGRLFLLRGREWTYWDDEQPEFDDGCGFAQVTYSPDGDVKRVERPNGKRGGSRSDWQQEDVSGCYGEVPAFSDWAGLSSADDVELELVPVDVAEQEPADPPWQPSAPLRPLGVDGAFRAGTRWTLPRRDETVVVELVAGGTVRMPSGQVVAADPSYLGTSRPFSTAVVPGDYPVELSVVRFADQPDHTRVAAARLVVSPAPVVSWEPALKEGQDVVVLGEGEFYGFGVDGGVGCFTDAAACTALAELIEESQEAEDLLMTPMGPTTAVLTEPTSGATLVAYHSGWGDGTYPVWIGRSADGEVACFVADMLVLRQATEALPDAVGADR